MFKNKINIKNCARASAFMFYIVCRKNEIKSYVL